MSFLTELLNRSMQKVMSMTENNEEIPKKRKHDSEAPDLSHKKKKRKLDLEDGDEFEVMKKKKKKKDKHRVADDDLAGDTLINESTDVPSPKKKKKKEKHREENEENSNENTSSHKKKKKKRKDNEENDMSIIDSDGDKTIKKKKKKKDNSDNISGDACDKNIKVEPCEKIARTPATSKNTTLITDIYCPPDPDIITGELYNVVMHILDENITMSNANTVWTGNCVPKKEEREKLSQLYDVRFFNFTEHEDDCILKRLKSLKDTKVISNMNEFATQLKAQNGNNHKLEKDKATRNIVGLYVGQDLPNRLAHSVSQRLLFLMTGNSILNNYQHKLVEKRKEGVEYKIRQQHRGWTVDEDELLIRSVLKSNIKKKKYTPVEQLDEKEINWEEVSQSLKEYGRTPQLVRERWSRTVKVMLLEGEEGDDPAKNRLEYRKELLQFLLILGVTDRKEIRWKEVATHFYPKTSSMLSQDFWAMIKRRKNPTLTEKMKSAMKHLEGQAKTGRSEKVVKKKEDIKSQLLDYYNSLPKL